MAAPDPAPLLTRAGHILWRELPEEYRYRDNPPAPKAPGDPPEPGDLAAFLHGMGHLLDLIRGTTEQLHADSFAEPVTFQGPAGPYDRTIQTWVLPYLADLVGAELMAPDPAQRVPELNNTVRWYKSKGTLSSIDELGDVLTGAETVAREGWRQVLTTPRTYLPPFTLPKALAATAEGTGMQPLGTPDFRKTDRAVRDPSGSNPLYRIVQPRRDANGAEAAPLVVHWKSRAPGGVPCFPGAYDDIIPRTPDLREPDRTADPGPHPRRTMIHVRPPDGLFAEGLKELALPVATLQPSAATPRKTITPAEAFRLAGQPIPEGDPIPDRVIVKLSADMAIAAGRELRLEGILITGTVNPGGGARPVRISIAPGARLEMDRASAPRVVAEGMGPVVVGETLPSLDARDSLIGDIAGGTGFARLEYVTVLGETDVTILQASDCLLGTLTNNFVCSAKAAAGPISCLRYSRATPPPAPADATACKALFATTNTTLPPRFALRWHCAPSQAPVLRAAAYGEPGCAVLAPDAPAAIRAGAEDEGEMGVHHHHYHAAELSALLRKLQAFLPLGQEASLIFDPMLALVPPDLLP